MLTKPIQTSQFGLLAEVANGVLVPWQVGKAAMVRSEDYRAWFSGVCLEGEAASNYTLDGCENNQDSLALRGLAPVTIFVGANNSGKSRLLRELFSMSDAAEISLESESGIDYDAQIKKILPGIDNRDDWDLASFFENDAVAEYRSRSRKPWLHKDDLTFIANLRQHQIDAVSRVDDQLRQLNSSDITASRQLNNHKSRLSEWQQSVAALLTECGLLKRLPGWRGPQRCYIPILRGMRPPSSSVEKATLIHNQKDCYWERTVNDYFSSLLSEDAENRGVSLSNPKLSVFTGLSLYSEIQRRLLSAEQEQRESIVNYQDFLSQEFFSGQSVLLIPALVSEDGSPNDVVYIRIGNEQERRIHDLGDGMQSLIVTTFPIVTETKPGSLFFIEEPDLCMHPSLQRSFLDTLKSYSRKMGHQFFITTHSNHMLDLVGDSDLVSVLIFSQYNGTDSAFLEASGMIEGQEESAEQRRPSFRIRSAKTKDREILSQLGVRPSSTFLANSTIWVEGISDASYLRAFMECFLYYLETSGGAPWRETAIRLRQYKEDNHYSFVEYNGSNLEHFSFDEEWPDFQSDISVDSGLADSQRSTTHSPSLCAEAIVIADGDISTKRDRVERFGNQLKHRLIVLPGKEVENLIPEEFVKQQVRCDHASPGSDNIEPELVDGISYHNYARGNSGSSQYIGLGEYLGGHLGIAKYSGSSSGTLPDYYKRKWRSVNAGIPGKMRDYVNAARLAGTPVRDAHESPINRLPSFLNADMIWLCICIYAHVAKCNHDKTEQEQLMDFKAFVREKNAPAAEGEGLVWPIQNSASAQIEPSCLIGQFNESRASGRE